MKYKYTTDSKGLHCRSLDYNFDFNKKTGFFRRWGKTYRDDPVYAPSPEILDMEISTICHGAGKPCPWCYKSNTSNGINMSLETFKQVLSKIPSPPLGQIAFGIGDVDGNPDLFKILDYTRAQGIIPNITINGFRMRSDYYDQLAQLCGAIAVSHYNDNTCFNAVEHLTDRGMKQVNIHALLCQDTLSKCFDLVKKIGSDVRLKKLNAVVFLLLKPKGDRNQYKKLKSLRDYRKLVEFCLDSKVQFGMDSCSAPLLMKSMEGSDKINLDSVEPCESFGLFSAYVNVLGFYFPCSFAEGEGEWKEGIDLLKIDDFIKNVWFSPKVEKWRQFSLNLSSKCDCSLKKLCRPCPIFDITPCYIKDG